MGELPNALSTLISPPLSLISCPPTSEPFAVNEKLSSSYLFEACKSSGNRATGEEG